MVFCSLLRLSLRLLHHYYAIIIKRALTVRGKKSFCIGCLRWPLQVKDSVTEGLAPFSN